MRAVGLGQMIEHAHQRFQQLSGDLLEVGNDENAHHRRKQQQDPRHRVGRDQPGIHRHAAQKGDPVILMKNRVLHDLFDGFSAALLACQESSDYDQDQQPEVAEQRQEFLLAVQ